MVVWSARKFAEGEIDLWPFECTHIVAFRGTSREIFFPKEHSKDVSDKYNLNDEEKRLPSVLKTRYLLPDNAFGTQGSANSFQSWKNWYISKVKEEHGLNGEEAQNVWKEFLEAGKENRLPEHDEILDTKEPGVFFAPRSVVEARDYYDPNVPESILLKMLIPTDSFVFNNRDMNGENIRCRNLEMMKRQFGSKENLRKLCQEVVRTGNQERIQYITADADLNWVEGVLDNYSPSEGFVSLPNYVRWLKKKCVWEMDKFSFDIEAHDAIKDELSFLKELYYLLQKLEYYISFIENKRSNLQESTEEIGEDLKYSIGQQKYLQEYRKYLLAVEKCITGEKIKGPGYDQVLSELERVIEEECSYFSTILDSEFNEGYKLDTSHLGRNFRNLQDLYLTIPSELKEIKNIKKEVEKLEKKFENDFSENYQDPEKFKGEINYGAKMDRRIFKKIKELPRLSNLKREVEKDLSKLEESDSIDFSYYQGKAAI